MTTRRIGELRRAKQQLAQEVARLESEVALLEKQADARAGDEALAKRLEDRQASLEAKQAELDSVDDELAGAEDAREEEAQGVDELERLVDAFAETIARVPELGGVLSAMKLTVGALATTKRLGRANEALVEPPQIAAALTQALTELATFMSTRPGTVRIPDALVGSVTGQRRERFAEVPVQHRGRAGVAAIDVEFDAS